MVILNVYFHFPVSFYLLILENYTTQTRIYPPDCYVIELIGYFRFKPMKVLTPAEQKVPSPSPNVLENMKVTGF